MPDVDEMRRRLERSAKNIGKQERAAKRLSGALAAGDTGSESPNGSDLQVNQPPVAGQVVRSRPTGGQ